MEMHRESRLTLPIRLSALVYNRNAFLAFVIIVSALKLFLSAIAPASYDLRDIIKLLSSGQAPVGPWLALYPPLYGQSASDFTQLQAWWLASPPTMGFDFRLISLLFRLPIFAFDVATAIIVYYLATRLASPVEGRLASLIWFANPLSVLSIELLGVPDVVATFLVVVAVSLMISRRPLLSGAFLGLGTLIKLYPVLLLPPLLLFAHSRGSSRGRKAAIIFLGLIGLVGYVSWILPFGLTYLTNFTPVTQPLDLVGGLAVNGSAFALISFYCLVVLFGRRTNLIAMLLPTFLVFYASSSLSFYHPQYLTWAFPLMALDIALVNRSRAWLFAIFNALAFGQWFFVSSAFLTPSGYSLLMIPLAGTNLPWYSHAVTGLLENYSVTLLLPFVASGFFASVLIYAADIARSWFVSVPQNKQQGKTP